MGGVVEDPDVKMSREGRVAKFQEAAKQSTQVDPSLLAKHNIETIIDPETEHIAAILSADEIDGMPSVKNHMRVKGAIEVALIVSKIPDRRPYLIFSVNSGTVDLKILEFFSYNKCLPCCGDCCSSGDFGYFYEMKSSVDGQFFALAADNVADFIVNRKDTRSFTATAGNGKKMEWACYCINCTTCSAFCCGGCFRICGIDCSDLCGGVYTDAFIATDTLVVGAEPAMNREAEFIANQVKWDIASDGNQELNLVLKYSSPLGGLRECKLKLNQNQTFMNAKKFGSTLQSLKVNKFEQKTSGGCCACFDLSMTRYY